LFYAIALMQLLDSKHVDTTRHMMFAPLRKLTLVNVCLKLVDTTRRMMFALISSSAPQAHPGRCLP